MVIIDSYIKNCVVLDIETTGLNPEENAKIIEIGAVKVKDHKIVDKYHTLINPECEIPLDTLRLCEGLEQEQNKIYQSPKIEDIREEFLKFIEDLPLICHNSDFEEGFLKKYISGISQKFLDSCELACIVEPQLDAHKIDHLGKVIFDSKSYKENHRALDDAEDTLKILNCVWQDKIPENGKKFIQHPNSRFSN
ncbi:PolC-type DNA polymerase III [Natranaerofaba carboxydovora]|uniref:3'-5' exonuclease n=1 Tax=Natranaerofaba carboxydovora TaxID=2742683 RepID=UPI001F1471E3|nr:3'-5' exonuclease [Natranaerofaba carboxydovora]UMZ73556.1 DNA polymerase III PolC-type [Natranaerofaba carboxydovora]